MAINSSVRFLIADRASRVTIKAIVLRAGHSECTVRIPYGGRVLMIAPNVYRCQILVC